MSQPNNAPWTVKLSFKVLRFARFMEALRFVLRIYGKDAMQFVDICYSKQEIRIPNDLKGVLENGKPKVVVRG
jgi:hypothetical protein